MSITEKHLDGILNAVRKKDKINITNFCRTNLKPSPSETDIKEYKEELIANGLVRSDFNNEMWDWTNLTVKGRLFIGYVKTRNRMWWKTFFNISVSLSVAFATLIGTLYVALTYHRQNQADSQQLKTLILQKTTDQYKKEVSRLLEEIYRLQKKSKSKESKK